MFSSVLSLLALILIHGCSSQLRANIGGNFPQGLDFVAHNNDDSKTNGNLFGFLGRGIMNAMNGASSALSTGLSMASSGFPSLSSGRFSHGFNGNINPVGQPLVPTGDFGLEMRTPSGSNGLGPGFNVNFNGYSPTATLRNDAMAPSLRSELDLVPATSNVTKKPLTARSRLILSSKGSSGLDPGFSLNVNDAFPLRIANSRGLDQDSSAKTLHRKSSTGSESIISFDGRLPSHSVDPKSRSFSVINSNVMPSKSVSRMTVHTNVQPLDRVLEISRQTYVMTQKPSIITVHQQMQQRNLPSMAEYRKTPFK